MAIISVNARPGSRDSWARPRRALAHPRQLARRMSRHLALALLAFAGLQIWLLAAGLSAGLPIGFAAFALALLVLVAVPLASRTEAHWQRLGREALPCPALEQQWRRTAARLWLGAAALPPLWIGLALLASRLLGS